MAENSEVERNGCVFTWYIENFSYCFHKRNESLKSPFFTMKSLPKTKWRVLIYPKGYNNEGVITVCLIRGSIEDPNEISVNQEFSFLGADASPLKSMKKTHTFRMGANGSGVHLATGQEVFRSQRLLYLPQDKLTVCCRVWKTDSTNMETHQIYARTRIGVERMTSVWKIENFSSLKTSEIRNFEVEPLSERGMSFHVKLFLTGGSACDEKLQIQIAQVNPAKQIVSTCKISLLDSKGISVHSVQDEYASFERNGIWYFPQFISKNMLLNSENNYLVDDVLFLGYEFAISFGDVVQELYQFGHFPVRTTSLETLHFCDVGESLVPSSDSLNNDMSCLYRDQTLSDLTLRIDGETFPVHKNILCARSPVFRAMFTSDMKEKDSDSIEIPDLDVNTMRQLLVYIYTDTAEYLQWDNVLKLYVAADRFGLLALKNNCSIYLKSNLGISNACDVLILADLHQDQPLKKIVQYFILKNVNIFSSEKWKVFMKDNLQLAAETMHLRCLTN